MCVVIVKGKKEGESRFSEKNLKLRDFDFIQENTGGIESNEARQLYNQISAKMILIAV